MMIKKNKELCKGTGTWKGKEEQEYTKSENVEDRRKMVTEESNYKKKKKR